MDKRGRRTLVIKKSPLDKAIEELVEIKRTRNALRLKYKEVFETLDELDSAEATITSQVKLLARERSVVGRNIHLFDSPEITVSVIGRKPTKEYSLDLAIKHWPDSVINSVTDLRIDPKKVEHILSTGIFHDEDAEKAALPGKENTPAVTIKFK